MNFGTMQSRVASLLDRDDLTEKIRGWINDTRKDLALKYNFHYLYVEATTTTTAGSARYALPSDMTGHMTIFINQKKLSRLGEREADELGPTDSDNTGQPLLVLETETGVSDDAASGAPDYYIERGMDIVLYPTPDGQYSLKMKYYCQPFNWSETSTADNYQEDHIDRMHFEAVIYGAAWRGAIFLDDEVKENKYGELYRYHIQEMITREEKQLKTDLKVRMKTYKDYDLDTFCRLHKISR